MKTTLNLNTDDITEKFDFKFNVLYTGINSSDDWEVFTRFGQDFIFFDVDGKFSQVGNLDYSDNVAFIERCYKHVRELTSEESVILRNA